MNKRILIFGATGNIGKYLKDYFTIEGYEVVAPTRADCDLAKPGAVTDYLRSLNSVEHIINCSADQSVANFSEMTPEQITKMVNTNLSSMAEIYAYVAKSKWKVESILAISSVEAIRPRQGHALYGATKAALETLVRGACNELTPTRCNALRLGLISRPEIEISWPEGVNSWIQTTPLKRMGSNSDVAHAAAFLLSSTWITGEVLTLDGGNSTTAGW